VYIDNIISYSSFLLSEMLCRTQTQFYPRICS
jgi:hypothetical protein